jgi:UDP-2,3-diacylglucosamine pyrophosphatase LpxH
VIGEIIPAHNNYRSLFLSDFHLGSHNCKAERLYNFLLHHNAQRIYLVGDIVEDHHLKNWPDYHHDVVSVLTERALHGTEIIYIPGNHDSIFRHHLGLFGNLKICKNYSHPCIDGDILFVTHGDETDILPNYLWLWLITSFERMTGLPAWETMRKVFGKMIRHHTDHFEKKIRKLGHKNIICGHIHTPKISEGYMNIGDFTHHCTAIAEHHDGTFELLEG